MLRRLSRVFAFGNDERDVVELLIAAKAANLIGDRVDDLPGFELAMPLKSGCEPVLSVFLAGLIQSIDDSVGVECEGVAGSEFAFCYGAVPFWKQAQHGASRVEALEFAAGSQQQAGVVAAVGVAQAARIVVVFGEEKGCVGALYRV